MCLMSEWHDLTGTIPAHGYAVNRMVTVDETGAGNIVLLTLIDQRDGTLTNVILDPDLAGLLGWELQGVVGGYTEAAFGDKLEPVHNDYRAALLRQIVESLGGEYQPDDEDE